MFTEPWRGFAEQQSAAQRFAAEHLADPDDAYVGITGSVPARAEQARLLQENLHLVEVVTVAAIALIVGLTFRSVVAPLLAMGTAGIAAVVTLGVVGQFAQLLGVGVPAELQPLIVALLLGIVTDYAFFFLAGLRRHVAAGQPRRHAACAATAEFAPIVTVAGITVAGGTGAMVVAESGLFRAFGPGMALTVLVGLTVAVTLVPALMGLVGGWALWPVRPHPRDGVAAPSVDDSALAEGPAPRPRRSISLLTRKPVAAGVVVVSVAGLALAALPVRGLDLGLSFVGSLPADNEVSLAARAADAGFAPGILSPTELLQTQPRLLAPRQLAGDVPAGGGPPQALGTWAADRLLAVFFFVAGLELKREFVAGDLRDVRRAAVPVAAAVGGVIAPALVYLAVASGAGTGAGRGWAIPTATDIAFAVAVLAVIGRHLPVALRTFLLTLAVVDDLLAITIIALFYTRDLDIVPCCWRCCRSPPSPPWSSGGSTFGGCSCARRGYVGARARVRRARDRGGRAPRFRGAGGPQRAGGGPEAGPGLAERFEHFWRPVSAGVAVPVFAFSAAGVTVGGVSGLGDALSNRVALGIVLGLVLGKVIGVFAGTWAISRFMGASLDDELAWVDVLGLALLAGIGFTVSLLIGELAFGAGSERDDHVRVAVLAGSLTAALLASVVLRVRGRAYRRLAAAESVDRDRDGVPDVYQRLDSPST